MAISQNGLGCPKPPATNRFRDLIRFMKPPAPCQPIISKSRGGASESFKKKEDTTPKTNTPPSGLPLWLFLLSARPQKAVRLQKKRRWTPTFTFSFGCQGVEGGAGHLCQWPVGQSKDVNCPPPPQQLTALPPQHNRSVWCFDLLFEWVDMIPTEKRKGRVFGGYGGSRNLRSVLWGRWESSQAKGSPRKNPTSWMVSFGGHGVQPCFWCSRAPGFAKKPRPRVVTPKSGVAGGFRKTPDSESRLPKLVGCRLPRKALLLFPSSLLVCWFGAQCFEPLLGSFPLVVPRLVPFRWDSHVFSHQHVCAHDSPHSEVFEAVYMKTIESKYPWLGFPMFQGVSSRTRASRTWSCNSFRMRFLMLRFSIGFL